MNYEIKLKKKAMQNDKIAKGVARGKGGNSPPPNRKNCCRKMVLFPKALFLVTNFPKK